MVVLSLTDREKLERGARGEVDIVAALTIGVPPDCHLIDFGMESNRTEDMVELALGETRHLMG